MSGLHPGFIAGDLDETAGQTLNEVTEPEQQEKIGEAERNNAAEVEIPPKVTLLPLEKKKDVINEHPFKPVSAEEQKKGAAMYAQLLLLKREMDKAARKRMNKDVDRVIRLQKIPTAQQSAAAQAYWKRQILLGRV